MALFIIKLPTPDLDPLCSVKHRICTGLDGVIFSIYSLNLLTRCELVDLLFLTVYICIVAPLNKCENIAALAIVKVAHPPLV